MRRLVVVATLLLVASTIVVGGVQQTPDADNTVTRVAVQPDGDAEWTVTVRTRLETDEELRAYETFQSRFRENTSDYVVPFRTRIEGVVASGANATGREMDAQNVTAATDIRQLPRRWGVVTYSFTWTQFAAADGDSLVVGDVFAGGFFITENDTLVVDSPAGYALTNVEPTPDSRDDGTVRWRGQRDFDDGRPALRFTADPAATATDTTDADSGLPLVPVVLGASARGARRGCVSLPRPHDGDARAESIGGRASRTGIGLSTISSLTDGNGSNAHGRRAR
ncbi:MAG: hypothetical protein U5K28_07000 [Halobacteriales archaeon]|nr:hypothetical protein [Halobacteriales archaeon]